MVKEIKDPYSVYPEIAVEKNLKSYLLKGFEAKQIKEFLKKGNSVKTASNPNPKTTKEILSVKKNLVYVK